jgi:hypothetical protein
MPKLKKDQLPRVRLSSRGPHVSDETMRYLKLWRAAYGLPFGRSIDAAIQHACKDETFKLSLRGSRPSLKEERFTIESIAQ